MESVRTLQETLSAKVIKTNQLMLYTAKGAVFTEIRIKFSRQSEHPVEFLNGKSGGT